MTTDLKSLLEKAIPLRCRLILASEDLLDTWGSRTNDGRRITVEWGDPSPEGWYVPAFTVHQGQAFDADGVTEAVAIALQTSRHSLVRAVPDGVACRCGQYDDSDHGIEASELWRAHLIEAATSAVRDYADGLSDEGGAA